MGLDLSILTKPKAELFPVQNKIILNLRMAKKRFVRKRYLRNSTASSAAIKQQATLARQYREYRSYKGIGAVDTLFQPLYLLLVYLK